MKRGSYATGRRSYVAAMAVQAARRARFDPVEGPAAVLRGRRCLCDLPGSCRYCEAVTASPRLKSLDTVDVTAHVSFLYPVCGPFVIWPQMGIDIYQCVGNRIRSKCFRFNGRFFPSYLNIIETEEQYCHIAVVYDRQPDHAGANPVYQDIWQTIDQAGAVSHDAYSFLNVNNVDRFEVVWERKLILPPLGFKGGAPSASEGTVERNSRRGLIIDEVIDLRGLPTVVNFNGGIPKTGMYYITIYGDEDVNVLSTEAAWNLYYSCRWEFYDD